jgi:hypothetical protein
MRFQERGANILSGVAVLAVYCSSVAEAACPPCHDEIFHQCLPKPSCIFESKSNYCYRCGDSNGDWTDAQYNGDAEALAAMTALCGGQIHYSSRRCTDAERHAGYHGPPQPPAPKPVGTCDGLPINVDWCASPFDTLPPHLIEGNVKGLLGKEGTISCITVPNTVTSIRVWCHAYVENAPLLDGYCPGMGTSGCRTAPGAGDLGNVMREEGTVCSIPSNQYRICVYANNQDAGRTLYFGIRAGDAK